MSRLARLPVRVRVTLAFAGVMALVLGADRAVRLRCGSATSSTHTIDQGLRSRAADVSALVQQADSGLAESGRSPLTERGENLAQILDASGAIVDSTPTVRGTALLDRRASSRARCAARSSSTAAAAGRRGPGAAARHAGDARTGRRLVVVVGTPLDDRDDALRNLARRCC